MRVFQKVITAKCKEQTQGPNYTILARALLGAITKQCCVCTSAFKCVERIGGGAALLLLASKQALWQRICVQSIKATASLIALCGCNNCCCGGDSCDTENRPISPSSFLLVEATTGSSLTHREWLETCLCVEYRRQVDRWPPPICPYDTSRQ